MAKGTGLFSIMRGKVGSLVFFKNSLSSTKETQGVRQYVAKVSNPQSEAQATQRMKVVAATNFYRQLAVILNNAWQGEKYGNKSRFYFMKLALSQVTGIPFLDKGEKRFFPGEFPVSQGSLPTQTVVAFNGGYAQTSIKVADDFETNSNTTWGDVSQSIVNNTFGVKNGDKLTFIQVDTANGEFSPIYSYVIVNTESTSLLSDVMAGSHLLLQFLNSSLGFSFDNMQSNTAIAAAVIVSRYPENGGSTWLRSTAVMACSDSYLSQYMGTARYEAAAKTYMAAAESLSSDWYLNRGVTGGDVLEDWGGSDSNLSIVSIEQGEERVPALVASDGSSLSFAPTIATMSDGTKRVLANLTETPYCFAYQDGSGYRGAPVLANAANLAKVQAVTAYAAVTGYSGVTISGRDAIEDRP